MDWLLLQIKIMLCRSYSIGGENWFNKLGISLFMVKRYEDTQLGYVEYVHCVKVKELKMLIILFHIVIT